MGSERSSRLAALPRVHRELLVQSLVGDRRSPARERIQRRSGDGAPLPLSFAQERLWVLDQLQPGSPAYNLSSSFRLPGILDLPALRRALDELVRRHEALRTVFPAVDGRPVQVVQPARRVPFEEIDLRSFILPSRREREARRYAEREARRPFHLARGPLFRAARIQLGEDDNIVLLSMHHIVSDGWSMGILLRELGELYDAFRRRRAPVLPELPIQYADFAIWQRRHLQGPTLERLLDYWREALRGAPPLLDLPTDRPRPPVQSFRGASLPFSWPAEVAAPLCRLAAAEGATPFMLLLSLFSALLARRSEQEDMVVGSPIANRTRPEVEPLIGFFVNTLALRVCLDGDPGLRGLLARVREMTLQAYAHQDLPFEKLVEELQPERNLSHNPVFQVTFGLQTTPVAAAPSQPPPPSGGLPSGSGTAKFDLTLVMVETADGFEGALEHNTDLFEEETARRMAAQLRVLVEAALAEPDLPVSRLSLLARGERAQILGWTAGQAAGLPGRSLPARFEARAAARPETVAVDIGGREVTYGELNRRADRIAERLRARGLGPESRVALFLERSCELIAALLGTLKAGAAYVPLDPAYPAERLAFLCEDSAPAAILTQARLLEALPPHAAEVLVVDAGDGDFGGKGNPGAAPDPDQLAYVIYTSGSTGKPKGAMLCHRGLSSLLESLEREIRLSPEDRVLQLASASFDASLFEIAAALGAGATLCLASREDLLPGPELVRRLRSRRITLLTIPPSVLALVPEDPGPGLRTVVVAGEPCPADLAARWAPGRRFLNAYGPTETTIWSTLAEVSDGLRPPAIGRPIPNVRAYILDRHLEPAPVGVPGEIHVGGPTVGRGYLGRPDLTGARFIPDPWGTPGSRMYRTGDLGRYRPDGQIEMLRRVDHQVKVRGFRIELGEIEATLLAHPEVAQAAAVVREDRPGDRRVVAYAAPAAGGSPAPASLRRFLSERLPSHMVPAACVVLEALPLTPNGKLDRRALPPPEPAAPDPPPGGAPERGPAAEVVARLWAEVLGLPAVGSADNFFDLGGHSLLATQIAGRLTRALGVEIPVRLVFEHPDLGPFCAAVERLAPAAGSGDGDTAIPRLDREPFRMKRSALRAQGARPG
jgi:amino acid adenylation domain-containing protein